MVEEADFMNRESPAADKDWRVTASAREPDAREADG
jgi:hypothetical protein